MSKKLKESLIHAGHMPVDEHKKANSIRYIMAEAQKTEIKSHEYFIKKLLRQMTYIDRRVYAVQLLLAAIGVWLILRHTNSAPETEMTQLLMAVLGAAFSVLDIYESFKSYKYKMWEIEAACRYNLKEVILQRHIIVGAIGMICMILFAAVTSIKTSQSFLFVTGMYMMPLMAVCIIYLGILKLSRGRLSTALLTVSMTVFGVVFMILYTIIIRMVQENDGICRLLFFGCFMIMVLYYIRSISEIGNVSEEEIGWMA